jgi:hypothetical protein
MQKKKKKCHHRFLFRWQAIINQEKKKDDLADCFLQALYWRHLMWCEE